MTNRFLAHGYALVLLSFTYNYASSQTKLPQLGKSPVHEVIDAMTPGEKSLIVTGAKRREVVPIPLPGRKMKTITAVGGYTYPFIHLGIPSIMISDGPAGLRIAPKRLDDTGSYYCTAFPVASLIASSWDTSLAEQIGKAMGNEAKAYGVDVLLGPALNIHRDPLGGRSFEYYSEDPLISGKMTAAAVRGIQSYNVGACIKHFAANNQETARQTVDVIASERALREIYLRGFEIAVKEADPWLVMSSYNKINGGYTSQRKDLLDDILRKEWGFKGLVISDWYAGNDVIEQVKAGNDLLMPGLALWSDKIDTALRKGILKKETIDRNIGRILALTLKTNTFKDIPFSNKPDFKTNENLARRAAAAGMVLLKDTNATLPFTKSIKKIAVYGNYAYKNIVGGTGSGAVNNRYSVSIAKGLENAGYVLDDGLKTQYINYLKKGKPLNLKADSLITALVKPDSLLAELVFSEQNIEKQAIDGDIALVTIMRVFGEGGDRKRSDFYLSSEEQALIAAVSAAYHARNKKVIVVLNIGGVIETASWRSQADAILLTWLSGQEGGNATADVLSGAINPSGKLATTFPMDYNDVPSSKNFPGTPVENPKKVVYQEGIYVGYRYYDSFGIKTAYPFGHGLSYTKFLFSSLMVKRKASSGEIMATFTITNTGKVKGKEVAQLYLSAPAKTLDKPKMELKGFAKTRLLSPGESQTMRIRLTNESLASFESKTSSWIAEAGQYAIQIASSSDHVRLTSKITLSKPLVVEKLRPALVPAEILEEFIPGAKP